MKFKKSVMISTVVSASLILGSLAAFAAEGVEKISAYLNHDIKFVLDGSSWSPKDSDGNKLSAVIIDGSTYVPLKAVGEAFGASVKWEGDSQTIYMNSKGGAAGNEGIPYKDAQPSSNNNSGNSSTGSSGTGTSSKSGIITLQPGFSSSKVEEQMKEEAQKVIKMYADALKSGDTSDFEDYIDTYVVEKTNDNWVVGRDNEKKRFRAAVASAKAGNDSDVVVNYANDIKGVTLSDIESSDPYISDSLVSFYYSYSPENWNWSSIISVTIGFYKLDDGKYYLERVRIE